MDDEPETLAGPGLAVVDTLGIRLADQAQRIAARHELHYGWAGPAQVLLHHVSARPPAAVDRFERSEAPAAAVELASARLPTEGNSPGGGRPEPVARLVGMAPAVVARPSGKMRSSGATIEPEGSPLPADVRERLRPQAGPGAEIMRVHQGEVADTVARDRGADAVTLGRDVFFREGQFRPREPRGFGLLVHEATHVMQLLQPGVAWRRATGAGVQDEEAEALGRERRAGAMAAPEPRPLSPVRGRATDITAPVSARPPGAGLAAAQRASIAPGRPPGLRSAAPASGPAAQPMRAESGREVEPSPPRPAPFDMEELRRTLTRDLIRQLRAEFERGG